MSDFLLNTPYHTIYWLPDRVHVYEQQIKGSLCYITIREQHTNKKKECFTLYIHDRNYEYLRVLSQEIARKKYYKVPTLREIVYAKEV